MTFNIIEWLVQPLGDTYTAHIFNIIISQTPKHNKNEKASV